jgi:hypothetical protein
MRSKIHPDTFSSSILTPFRHPRDRLFASDAIAATHIAIRSIARPHHSSSASGAHLITSQTFRSSVGQR